MTKEELEKEAKEYADWFWGASPSMMKALAEAYIKGAEPREKRISDLEAENEQIKNSDTLCKLIGEQKIKIAELEKENAELRNNGFSVSAMTEQQLKVALEKGKQLREENARLNRLSDMQDKTVVDLTKTCEQRREQLTKAKEIIKKLLYVVKNHLHIADVSFNAVINDAEKILKEE